MPSAEEYLAKMEECLASEEREADSGYAHVSFMERMRGRALVYATAAIAAASLPRFEIEVSQSAHTEGETIYTTEKVFKGAQLAEKAAADPDVLQPADDDIGDL